MNAFKLIPVLACLLGNGCVGVGGWVCRTETAAFYQPYISDVAGLSGVRDQPWRGDTNTVTYSAEWLRSHWGEPKSITSGLPSEEVWTYKFGTCWSGVIPMLVIPIPLVLPLNSEKIMFQIRDGQVVRARRQTSARSGGGAGFGLGPEGPWAGGF